MFRNILITAALLVAAPAFAQQVERANAIQSLDAASSGYAEAAEGLRVYYETYGEGEPIVVLAGALMPIKTMAQVTGPLSQRRRVVAIDLEGHGRTGLRDTPMSHERNGDDIAAVLRHLGIGKADVAGYCLIQFVSYMTYVILHIVLQTFQTAVCIYKTIISMILGY